MRKLTLILAVMLLPLSLYGGEIKSTAAEASKVISATATQLNRLDVYNSKATAQYILVMNAASLPANGAVTLLVPPFQVPAKTKVSIIYPRNVGASTGVVVANSSTDFSGTTPTLTIGSADCFFYAVTQ